MPHLPKILFFSLVVILFSTPIFSYAQFAKAESEGLYKKEFSYGINFNTNGGTIGGLMLRGSIRRTPRIFHHFYFEAVMVKHPKELRKQIPSTGKTYIFGKRTYLYSTRFMYGQEFVLFEKAREQGVHVNAILAAGPSIGWEAPYLIIYDGREEQYDPAKHDLSPGKIEGVGNYIRAIGLAKPIPGFCAKAALSFEIGAFRQSVTGFEVGVMSEWLGREIKMLPEAAGQQSFQSVYVCLYFGSHN
jgi:hypothetical protein